MFLLQGFDGSQHTPQVVHLVRAQERQEHLRFLINEPRAISAPVGDRDPHIFRAVERVVFFACLFLDDCKGLGTLCRRDGGTVAFDDPRLLKRDRFNGIAENRGVIEVDARDDRAQGIGDEVGRIEQTSHSYLAHDDITFLLLKNVESQHGQKLKFCDDDALGVELFNHRLKTADSLCQRFFSDHYIVDLDTFPKVYDVRRGKQTDLVSRFLQYSTQNCANGAFAVGARDMDKRLSQHFGNHLKELFDPVQSRARAKFIE